jgi:hypothetical protein
VARKADEKAVVNAIVDEEIDLRDLVDRIKDEGSVAADQIMAMAKKLIGQPGILPKHLLREAWNAVFIARYVRIVNKLQEHTEQHLKEQIAVIKKFGRPITEIAAVVDEDVKERLMEKKLG